MFRPFTRFIGVFMPAFVDDIQFDSMLSSGRVGWVQPVGWLNADMLIVEVRNQEWSKTILVGVRFDDSEINVLARGGFAGFLYP